MSTQSAPGAPSIPLPGVVDNPAHSPERRRPLDLVGILVRLGLGTVMISAGLPKLLDLTGSVQNVIAYELFDYELARAIGIFLPVVEVALGVLLLLGLLTRAVAVVTGVLMLFFIAGIVSAWARGLSIDCGCFGTGGPVDPDETTYVTSIVRDVGFLGLAVWLTVRPHTPWSLDQLLRKGR